MDESRSMRAIRFGIAAADLRGFAKEHPEAERALMRAADEYSDFARGELDAIAARAERVRKRLKADR